MSKIGESFVQGKEKVTEASRKGWSLLSTVITILFLLALVDRFNLVIKLGSNLLDTTESVITAGAAAPTQFSNMAVPPQSQMVSTSQHILCQAELYTIQKGDTAWGIAQKFGVPLPLLLGANEMSVEQASQLSIGQQLRIPVFPLGQ